jgi:transcriptional regulator with XRE-family HTH domain
LAQRTTKTRRTRRKGQIHPAPGPEKAFGEALRDVRKEKKLSQERLALDAGLDRTYISLIERGVRSPTVRAVVKLAEVLQARSSEIFRRMETHLAGRQKTAK